MLRHAIAISFLSLSSTVAGQSGDLKPLDQTVEDTSPLARSLRYVEPGLREPSAFEQVYNLLGREDLRMRINGGIYALFPQSAYSQGRNGPTPLIPAGTVFYIGEPDMSHLSQADSSSRELEGIGENDPYGRLDLRVMPERRAQVGQRQASASAVTAPFTGIDRRQAPEGSPGVNQFGASTIVTDARYRVNRIRELMQSAANAAGADSPETDRSPR